MLKLPSKTVPVKAGNQVFEQAINPNASAPFEIGIQPDPSNDPIGALHEKLDLQARAKEAKARLQRRKPGELAKSPKPSVPSPASSSAGPKKPPLLSASKTTLGSTLPAPLGSKKGKPKPKPKPKPRPGYVAPAVKTAPRPTNPRPVATPAASANHGRGGAPPKTREEAYERFDQSQGRVPFNDPADSFEEDYPIPAAYDEPATPEEAEAAFVDLPDGEVVDDRMLGLLQKVARHGLTPWKNSLPFGGFPRWPRLTDSARRGMVERFRALCTLDIVQHVASQLVQKSGALSNTVLARGTATSLAWLAWHALEYDLDFKPREVLPG